MRSDNQDSAQIHSSSLVIDTHADTPQRFLDEQWEFTGPLASTRSTGQINLASARAGNLAAEFFALWVDPGQHPKEQYVSRTLTLLDAVREQVRRHPQELALCLKPEDVLAARSQGRFAVLLGIEGGHSIANSLALLRCYHVLGVRYMTLTWANSNDWAESSGDLRDLCGAHGVRSGLTEFGRQVIAEMNRIGMMVDVSHASDQTLADVLAATRVPIIASHSSARALCDSPRNLTDDQLRAIAANGGAIMVNFYAAFLDDAFRQALNALKPEREEAHRRLAAQYAPGTPLPFYLTNAIDREFAARVPRPSFETLIDHFDHILRVAGVEHVGVGTDFDGISALPEGIDSAADLPKITAALLARGHSADDMRKVLGGNLMRVFAAVQAAAEP